MKNDLVSAFESMHQSENKFHSSLRGIVKLYLKWLVSPKNQKLTNYFKENLMKNNTIDAFTRYHTAQDELLETFNRTKEVVLNTARKLHAVHPDFHWATAYVGPHYSKKETSNFKIKAKAKSGNGWEDVTAEFLKSTEEHKLRNQHWFHLSFETPRREWDNASRRFVIVMKEAHVPLYYFRNDPMAISQWVRKLSRAYRIECMKNDVQLLEEKKKKLEHELEGLEKQLSVNAKVKPSAAERKESKAAKRAESLASQQQ